MPKFATGKYAKAISDRSGMAFPYNEMVFEWNGSFVHTSEFEAKAPQVQPGPHPADGIALLHTLLVYLQILQQLVIQKEEEAELQRALFQ